MLLTTAILVVLWCVSNAWGQDRPAQVDAVGDPLPRGAVARIGTTRFRQPRIRDITFAPDGKTIISAGFDGRVIYWDRASGRELQAFHLGDQLGRLAFSPDGKVMASGSFKSEVKIWDTDTGKELRVLVNPAAARASAISGLTFSPNGQLLVGTRMAGEVMIWRADSGQLLKTLMLTGTRSRPNAAFAPDGKTLAVSNGNAVQLWDVASWEPLGVFNGHRDLVVALAFSNDGKTLFTVSFDCTARFWDVATRTEKSQLGKVDLSRGARDGLYLCMDVSPVGKSLAVGREDGMHQILDTASGKELIRWQDPDGEVSKIVFSPDGQALASTTGQSIRLWDPATGRRLDPYVDHANPVFKVLYSPTGKVIASRSWTTLDFFDAINRKKLGSMKQPPNMVATPGTTAFSPDGRWLAQAESVKRPPGNRQSKFSIVLFDTSTGEIARKFPERDGVPDFLAFSPDGQALNACMREGGFQAWETATGKERSRFTPPVRHISSYGISPDGRVALVEELDRGMRFRLWDISAEKPIAWVGDRDPRLRWASLSADSRVLALPQRPSSSGREGEATELAVIEVASGQERGRLRGQRFSVAAAALAPDGRSVGTASTQEPIRLWDLVSGKELAQADARRASSLDFSPDGKTLLSGHDNGTLLIWDLDALLPQSSRPKEKLGSNALQQLWADLADSNAARAFQAIATLSNHPTESFAFLRENLGMKSDPVDAARVEQLIKELDAASFKNREEATKGLAKMGGAARPLLRRAIQGKNSPEVQHRLERLLSDIDGLDKDREQLPSLRVIEVLEHIGTEGARTLLRQFQVSSQAVAQEAERAMARLSLKSQRKE